jgi:hypothetical protein
MRVSAWVSAGAIVCAPAAWVTARTEAAASIAANLWRFVELVIWTPCYGPPDGGLIASDMRKGCRSQGNEPLPNNGFK